MSGKNKGKDKSSVTVNKDILRDLNALVILGKRGTLNHLIESMVVEHINNLTPDEKKKFDLLVELLEQKD